MSNSLQLFAAAILGAASVSSPMTGLAATGKGLNPEESALAWRLGLSLGGAYTSNAYFNAVEAGDSLGLSRLTLDADWNAADWALLKLSYRGDLEAYRELTTERQVGNLGDITLGIRPSDRVYVSLKVGGENAYYPGNSVYGFTGSYGAAGVRVELGESLTLKANYRIRQDAFPQYDLDNKSQTAQVILEAAAGDHVELSVPFELTATSYSERFLLDAAGNPTSERRASRAWRLEPTIRILPSYSLRVTGGVRGEWNDSSDTYSYTGPFGVATTSVPPELINNFDAYYGFSSRWELRWQPADSLVASGRVAAGARWYSERPAYDKLGVVTGEHEQDLWAQPAFDLEWRFSGLASLIAGYSYLYQSSNDALWAFDGHRVDVALSFWFDG